MECVHCGQVLPLDARYCNRCGRAVDAAAPAPRSRMPWPLVVLIVCVVLVVGIAMLGILAAIAIPAYQDYTVRARMNEILVEVDEVHVRAYERLAETLDSRVVFDQARPDWLLIDNTTPAPAVQNTYAREGLLVLQLGTGAPSALAGRTLALEPWWDERNDRHVWICGYADYPTADHVNPLVDANAAEHTTVERRYLPARCR